MIDLTNAIGVQVAVLGNHEFDFGPELVAEERIKAARYPWLGTNVLAEDGAPAVGSVDLQLLEVGGYKIGFFGLLTPETATLSSARPGHQLRPARRRTAAAAVKRLEEMGADLVVALTHLDLADDRALAADVEGIDLVLGGHDHEPMTFFEGGTLIVKAGSDLHYLAAIDLARRPGAEKDKEVVVVWTPSWRYLATAGVAPEPKVQAIVARWNTHPRPGAGGAGRQRHGRARHAPASACAPSETNFGDLVGDALRSATGAEVALTNGGGIRGDRIYPAGTVLTRKDILTELPFGNVAVLAEVTGADLLAALENGVSQVEDKAGRFPQVSGMSFVFDAAQARRARAIVEATVDGAPLDPAGTYRLATSDYLLGGGDGYASLTQRQADRRRLGRALAGLDRDELHHRPGRRGRPYARRADRRAAEPSGPAPAAEKWNKACRFWSDERTKRMLFGLWCLIWIGVLIGSLQPVQELPLRHVRQAGPLPVLCSDDRRPSSVSATMRRPAEAGRRSWC